MKVSSVGKTLDDIVVLSPLSSPLCSEELTLIQMVSVIHLGLEIEMYYQLLVLIFRSSTRTLTAVMLHLLTCPALSPATAVESPLEIIRKEMKTVGANILTFKGNTAQPPDGLL